MAKGLIIAAAGSGQGKTLVTAGLARALMAQGHKVKLFKMGPDYLDPMFLQAATGLPVHQLDYWMLGSDGVAAKLADACQDADAFVLVEGMMGLFDGRYPTARLAVDQQLPVLLVIDGSAMAQTFGALVEGLVGYDAKINIAGVIANRAGSDGHGEMLRDSVKQERLFLGWMLCNQELSVKERHLGIETDNQALIEQVAVQAEQRIAPWLSRLDEAQLQLDIPHLQADRAEHAGLSGINIAVARDAAFQFIYAANIDFLEQQGAVIQWFSPLTDRQLPACDSLYLPGGYPELHLLGLSQNHSMLMSIDQHIKSDKPCLAECGGMLYLLDSLSWKGVEGKMVGALAGSGVVTKRLAAIGYQKMPDGALKGHSFHHGRTEGTVIGDRALNDHGAPGEAIYRFGGTIASFVHWYFPSDPDIVVRWFKPSVTAVGSAIASTEQAR